MRRMILISMTALLLAILLSISIACSTGANSDGNASVIADSDALDDSAGSEESTATVAETTTTMVSTEGVLLFGIGMHIEPRGAVPSPLVGGNAAGPASDNK